MISAASLTRSRLEVGDGLVEREDAAVGQVERQRGDEGLRDAADAEAVVDGCLALRELAHLARRRATARSRPERRSRRARCRGLVERSAASRPSASAATATRAAAARPASQSRRIRLPNLRHGEGDGHVRGRLLRSRLDRRRLDGHRLVGCIGRAAAARRRPRRSRSRGRARGSPRRRAPARSRVRSRPQPRAPGGRARSGRRSRATVRRPGSRPRSTAASITAPALASSLDRGRDRVRGDERLRPRSSRCSAARARRTAS